MSETKTFVPRVSKHTLLLIAGLVWCFAGSKILSMGIPDVVNNANFPIIDILVIIVVFYLFFQFIFGKLVNKHLIRIEHYEQAKICAFAFFDIKSYIIMIGMITFGILFRNSHLLMPACIGTFYTGLGIALGLAGICILIAYIKKLINQHKEKIHGTEISN